MKKLDCLDEQRDIFSCEVRQDAAFSKVVFGICENSRGLVIVRFFKINQSGSVWEF